MLNKNNKTNDVLFNAKSKKDVIRLLKNGVNINALNEHRQNALFHCRTPEAMQAMIDAGINIHHLDSHAENALFHINDKKSLRVLFAMELISITEISLVSWPIRTFPSPRK